MAKKITVLSMLVVLFSATVFATPADGGINPGAINSNQLLSQTEAYRIYKSCTHTKSGEIQYLIQLIKQSKLKIIRSGREYSSRQAAKYLSVKYKATAKALSTTEQFIDKFASFTDGNNPIYVIGKNGKKYTARQVLYSELRKLRNFEAKTTHQAKL